MTDRMLSILGWVATCTAIAMYASYVDQIRLNLDGHKGSIVQPIATVVNCALWALYGLAKPKRDWLIVCANSPGIVLGALTLATAL